MTFPSFETLTGDAWDRREDRGPGEPGDPFQYQSLFEFVPHPNLRALMIKGDPIQTEYCIAFLKERRNSAKIRAFLEVVARMKGGARRTKAR